MKIQRRTVYFSLIEKRFHRRLVRNDDIKYSEDRFGHCRLRNRHGRRERGSSFVCRLRNVGLDVTSIPDLLY